MRRRRTTEADSFGATDQQAASPLPPSLQALLRDCTWHAVTIGASTATVFRLERPARPAMFLKVAPTTPERTLLRERQVLDWLQDKLPVPRVIAFAEDDRADYLLLSALPGTNAAEVRGIAKPTLVRLLAHGLRMVHRLPTEGCPFDWRLDRAIEAARFNVLHGLVDESDFDEARRGRSAADLFEELLRTRPSHEEPVFTHGDYCLPNVLVRGRQLTGFVDLGRAGIADRYRDLALAVRSIRHNLGRGLDELFLRAYGLEGTDWGKIEYYMLLDEFF